MVKGLGGETRGGEGDGDDPEDEGDRSGAGVGSGKGSDDGGGRGRQSEDARPGADVEISEAGFTGGSGDKGAGSIAEGEGSVVGITRESEGGIDREGRGSGDGVDEGRGGRHGSVGDRTGERGSISPPEGSGEASARGESLTGSREGISDASTSTETGRGESCATRRR